MPDKELWEALRTYCKQLGWGEFVVKLKVRRGKAVFFEEDVSKTRRTFQAEEKNKKDFA